VDHERPEKGADSGLAWPPGPRKEPQFNIRPKSYLNVIDSKKRYWREYYWPKFAPTLRR
jgi:hypothetical protein